jgi:molybdenum cofactor biosynthesis enzyme MoaA
MATTLELLKNRREKADANIEGFRTHCDGLDDYLKISEYITYFSYLRALSQAPYTMNPEKIKKHFSKVAQYMISKAAEDEVPAIRASAQEFISGILSRELTSVKEYSVCLGKWINANIPESIKREASRLAGNAQSE